jgi:hypothetical protein
MRKGNEELLPSPPWLVLALWFWFSSYLEIPHDLAICTPSGSAWSYNPLQVVVAAGDGDVELWR